MILCSTTILYHAARLECVLELHGRSPETALTSRLPLLPDQLHTYHFNIDLFQQINFVSGRVNNTDRLKW